MTGKGKKSWAIAVTSGVANSKPRLDTFIVKLTSPTKSLHHLDHPKLHVLKQSAVASALELAY